MKGKCIYSFVSFLLLLSMFGCGGKPSRVADCVDESPELSYARQFSIARGDNYTTLTVFNPWKMGDVYAVYYLVKDEAIETPADGIKVLIPLKRLMVNSSTHLGFIELLDELPAVAGICSADYVYNPTIRQAVKKGKVKDLGYAYDMNYEELMLLQPEAVMTTAYNAEDTNNKKMRQSGLTLIYNIEWQEESLLGRAEWIKFIAAFFDKDALADSIFESVAQRYNEIKQMVDTVDYKPTILSGQDYRGGWSMPSGGSFNARLFCDAGGDYYYKDEGDGGSIPVTIEEALIHFSKADVWVNVQASTLEELGKMEAKYKFFKAYKEGNVYNTRKRVTDSGGNDYWEGAVARPDLLLSDMIKVLHPELLPEYELTYLEKLTK